MVAGHGIDEGLILILGNLQGHTGRGGREVDRKIARDCHPLTLPIAASSAARGVFEIIVGLSMNAEPEYVCDAFPFASYALFDS